MSEQTEFLKELGLDAPRDVFEQQIGEVPVVAETETAEQAEQKLKNRRERRLSERLQQEREANIALNARLETISESKQVRETTEEADYLKRVEKIYGTATPEAKEATELLKEAMRGLKESAKQEAIEELDKRRGNETQEVIAEEKNLDDISDRVEEDYNLDMSDDSIRRGYFSLMEKMSPKYEDGTIKEYADPDAVAETFKALQKRDSNGRAKELSSRSMTRSGASQDSKLEMSATERILKEAGII